MQLRCNRHRVSGVWVPLPCAKCARELRKKNSVDTRISAWPSQNYRSGGLSQAAQRTGETGAQLLRVKSKTCLFCQATADVVVFGLRVCRRHGGRISALPIELPCVGLAYRIALCAVVQFIRENP
jgi:hypothetical protein